MKYLITKRSNFMDYDGSQMSDTFTVIEGFNDLEKCKKKFNLLISDIDKNKNITEKHSVTEPSGKTVITLMSEYREIEIIPHYEKEWIALEIIQTNGVGQKGMFLVGSGIDGVKSFTGHVTALQQEYEDCKICGDVILYCKCHEDVIKDIEGK